jgi:hypothetical protein
MMGFGEILGLPIVREVLEALGMLARANEPQSAGPTKRNGRALEESTFETRSDEPGDVDSGGVYFGLSLADLGYGHLVGNGDQPTPADARR